MGDFTAYIQHLYDIQKKKRNFGSVLEPASKQQRAKEITRQRKENRDQELSRRRRISNKIEPVVEDETTTTKTMSRLERLAQWKVERERKKIESTKKMKPIFKVHSITTTIGLPNLENVNRQIKGKLFVNEKSQFAPDNHQFKPPANIKPIYFNGNNNKNNNQQNNKINIGNSGVRTRSQARKEMGDNVHFKSNSDAKRFKTENQPLQLNTLPKQNSKTVPTKKTSNKTIKQQKTTEQVPEDNPPNHNKTSQTTETISNRTPLRELSKISEIIEDEPNEIDKTEDIEIKTNRRGRYATRRQVIQSNEDNIEKIIAKTSKSEQIEEKSNDEELNDENQSKTRKTKRGRITKRTVRKNNDITTTNINDNNTEIIDNEIIISNKTIQTPKKRSTVEIENYSDNTETKTPKNNKTRQKEDAASAENNENTKKLDESIKTPIKPSINHNEDAIVYISPFVTISRGKDNARKEYADRRLRTDFSPTEANSQYTTSPKAAACYFTRLLNNEIDRLEVRNDEWINYKETGDLSEDAQSMIDVAVGQSKLLIKQKFQQFQNLIDTCKDPDNPQPIQCTDLHGFWDLLYIQITNIDQRFDNLQRMKSNNWNELQPEIKKSSTKRIRIQKPKAVQATSVLRQAIQAARKKKQQQDSEDIKVEIVAASANTPLIQTSNRKSLLNSVQKDETKLKRNSSPGLMMMKVARLSRSFTTPNKGILRSDAGKSTGKSKSVIFQDDSNNENDLNCSNQESPHDNDDDKTFIRRSSRLSKSKLF